MRNINACVVCGNLTRDAELRQTADGMPVLSFSVAVNDSRKNAAGEWEDYANFIDCIMFGERAEKLAPRLSKGLKVTVFGKLHWSKWERDGYKMSKVEIKVGQVEFSAPKDKAASAEPDYSPIYDDDIPF